MIKVESKRRKIDNIQRENPNSVIIDVTSKGELPFLKFSPFYPIGDIPIPFSDNEYSESMEGIWQGLKVFDNYGIDRSKFTNKKMKNLKRTVRKYGFPKGHQKGTESEELLDYFNARKLIYLPTYKWILEYKLKNEMDKLRSLLEDKTLILLDYETNGDINNLSKPLSHASIVKHQLEC